MEELTELLHRAYAPLAAMGYHFFASHQSTEITASRCAAGETFVAESFGRLVGCVTLRAPGATSTALRAFAKTEDGVPRCYLRDDVAVFGQFAVAPELQKTGLGGRLLDAVERRAKQMCANEI